jgi:predicted RNase H-like nuclease (RuvC/YqgF family)
LEIGIFVLTISGVEETQTSTPWTLRVKSNKFCEDIFKSSRVHIRDYTVKFNNVDQMINALFQRADSIEQESQQTTALEHTVSMLLQQIDSLEQECNQSRSREEERQRIRELERTIASLLRRMDSLEQECNQLRATAIPQQSNSGSNNQITGISQAGNSGE